MTRGLNAVVRRGLDALRLALFGVSLCAALGSVAPTAGAAGSCPNEQLRAENESAQLPDCRAYEQVTPAGPYSAEFNGVSSGDNAVFFASSGALAGLPVDENNGNQDTRIFAMTRGGGGWVLSSATAFSGELFHTYPFVGSSADGSRVFVASLTSETPEGVLPKYSALNLYETVDGGPPVVISHDARGHQLTGGKLNGLMGPVVVSGDGSHVVFSSGSPLTVLAAESGGGPYVYEADAAGEVSLVSVTAGGALPPAGAGAGLGSVRPGEDEAHGVLTNAVSTDGSTVIFNSTEQYDPAAPAGFGTQVFVHRRASTIDVSKGIEDAAFDGASANGDRVAFSDPSEDLFEFDSAAHHLVRIASNSGLGSETFLAMSADGSHVYFASEQRLDPAAPAHQSNEPFLYEWVDGHVTYLASLSRSDVRRLTSRAPALTNGQQGGAGGQEDLTGTEALGPVRATADGAHLVFESEGRLTQDDHNTEVGRINIYEYSDGQGLTRVSAGSLLDSGNGPYDATIGSQQQLPSFAGASGEAQPFTFGVSQTDGRVLAEDGSVFFSSREALTDGASDGPLHVYEWREGRTYLIAPPGPNATDAHYLESSADGASVYFSATQAVLPSDTNGGWVNIWAARSDGGFPGAPPTNPCAENECPASAPAARATPPTTTFSGAGNATPNASMGVTPPGATAEPKTLTRHEMLREALKACKRKRSKSKRASCERTAHRRYAATAKSIRRNGSKAEGRRK